MRIWRKKTVRYVLDGWRASEHASLTPASFNLTAAIVTVWAAHAAKRRHLSPYAVNPFAVLEVERSPVEGAKPIGPLTPEQERSLLQGLLCTFRTAWRSTASSSSCWRTSARASCIG